jgi:DNA-binding FrmR family transcriptional regulator
MGAEMASNSATHVLENRNQLDAIAKRMKRAYGQMGAVIRMLEDGRSCEDIVTQMAAVGKAVNTAAFKLISASLKECIEEATIDSDAVTEKLQKLFLSLA